MKVGSLYGAPIHTSELVPLKPRIQLGADVPVSDTFRRDMNAWLAEYFGTSPEVLSIDDPFNGRYFAVHPKYWPQWREQLRGRQGVKIFDAFDEVDPFTYPKGGR